MSRVESPPDGTVLERTPQIADPFVTGSSVEVQNCIQMRVAALLLYSWIFALFQGEKWLVPEYLFQNSNNLLPRFTNERTWRAE